MSRLTETIKNILLSVLMAFALLYWIAFLGLAIILMAPVWFILALPELVKKCRS
ncbi:MAG: hypothetical protein WCO26_24130 [Deltaproteobacteria bacterium]